MPPATSPHPDVTALRVDAEAVRGKRLGKPARGSESERRILVGKGRRCMFPHDHPQFLCSHTKLELRAVQHDVGIVKSLADATRLRALEPPLRPTPTPGALENLLQIIGGERNTPPVERGRLFRRARHALQVGKGSLAREDLLVVEGLPPGDRVIAGKDRPSFVEDRLARGGADRVRPPLAVRLLQDLGPREDLTLDRGADVEAVGRRSSSRTSGERVAARRCVRRPLEPLVPRPASREGPRQVPTGTARAAGDWRRRCHRRPRSASPRRDKSRALRSPSADRPRAPGARCRARAGSSSPSSSVPWTS